ncbi:hypothetical protein [Endozoicomonas numazuensis]|uniref:Growth arrest-specific protein 8 domain-containing protein n=1 Tax=Endozoicomonas numazuensis TaxID=1137799 RepID=A0A081NFA1_9GAMM|nr:hypothetical protein [Endozoicomonas numazuensis]KEQ17124.1 hypothetical protein GZ78_14720 [Endozoicomonas numazuensis]
MQPFEEVLQEKVPRSFKKKLADAARKLKSKTYGDLKRWVLGQNLKPMPQGLIDRVSYDGKMQGMATERNQMIATLTELKEELNNLKDELSRHKKDSPRYQEIRSGLVQIKAQIKSIPLNREKLKGDIEALNKEMIADLPRFGAVERQIKGP